MITERLEKSIVDTDRRLNQEATTATNSLAHWRWYWTLDEGHVERISMNSYAKLVGMHSSTIRRYAQGYELVRTGEETSIIDAIQRVHLGEDAYEAARAIADERGTSVSAVRKGHASEVRHVRDVARDRAARHGTSVADEVQNVVRQRRESMERATAQHRERASRTTVRADVASSRLVAARRSVLDAIEQLVGVDLEEDDVELLNDRLDKLEVAVGLMRARTRGESGVDWDAEYRDLLEVG